MDPQNVLAGLDELYARGTAPQIEAYLRNHIFQAQMEGDPGMLLTLNNELMGLCRTTGRYQEGLQVYEETKLLLQDMGLAGSLHYASTVTNAATLCRAAGWLDRAEYLFREALAIYEKSMDPTDLRLASMYNNLSLLKMDRKEYGEAKSCLEKSLAILSRLPGTVVEQATNHTNLANLCMQMEELEEAERHLLIADRLYGTIDHEASHVGSFRFAWGQLETLRGNDADAAAHYRASLAAIQRYYGRSRSYGVTEKNLAAVLRRLGQDREAEELERDAAAILESVR